MLDLLRSKVSATFGSTETESGSEESDKKSMTEQEPNLDFVVSGIVDLTIHKAENLEKCDIFGKGDPYVIVTVNGHRVHKTAVKHGTQQPTFNESKQCFVADVTKSRIILGVYDQDKIGADTFLGEVQFNLVRLRNTFLEFKAIPLTKPDNSAKGNLFISLSYRAMPIIPITAPLPEHYEK